jgi:hypothetical protein
MFQRWNLGAILAEYVDDVNYALMCFEGERFCGILEKGYNCNNGYLQVRDIRYEPSHQSAKSAVH